MSADTFAYMVGGFFSLIVVMSLMVGVYLDNCKNQEK